MQSTDDSFNTRLTTPILTAFVSEKRYIAKSADSFPSSKRLAWRNIWTFLWLKGNFLWLHVLTPRPIICSIALMLYHGSITCIWRIFFKSTPSDPDFEMMTTLHLEPSKFLSERSAFISMSLFGEMDCLPVISAYFSLFDFIEDEDALEKSDFDVEFSFLYLVNPISSNASAIGITPLSIK